MSRSAIYAKNNPSYRIACVANDLWRLQEHGNHAGTKTSDPWFNRSPVLSFADANAELNRFALQHASTVTAE